MPQLRPPPLEDLANCPRCGGNKWSRFTYFNPKLGEGYRCGACHTSWKEWFKLRLELIEAYDTSKQTVKEEKKNGFYFDDEEFVPDPFKEKS